MKLHTPHADPYMKTRLLAACCAFSLVLLLFCSSCAAEESAAAGLQLSGIGRQLIPLQMMRQGDPELNVREYQYKRQSFSASACMPACVTNALHAMFAVEDRDQAKLLLRDVMYMLSNGLAGKVGCDLKYMPRLTAVGGVTEWDMEACPALRAAIAAFGGDITVLMEHVLTKAEVLAAAQAERKQLLMARIRLSDDWSYIPRLAAALTQAGYGDTRMALVRMSVGQDRRRGPFRHGEDGHFVSFYLQAQELHETGTLYLLDSLKRCISAEEQSARFAYSIYPYASELIRRDPRQHFNTYYDTARVNDNIIAMVLRPDVLSAMNELPQEERLTSHGSFLSTMDLSGYGMLMLLFP